MPDVDHRELHAPFDVHRTARRDLVRNVERGGAEVAVGNRTVERRKAVVGARDARGKGEQILGVRIRVAHIELEALTEAFLHLCGE